MTLQEAIQELHEMREDTSLPVYYALSITDVIDTLLTDVQEVRHGRWKTIDKGHYFYDWECSVCGGSGRADYLFCPNCGAKMDEEEQE